MQTRQALIEKCQMHCNHSRDRVPNFVMSKGKFTINNNSTLTYIISR